MSDPTVKFKLRYCGMYITAHVVYEASAGSLWYETVVDGKRTRIHEREHTHEHKWFDAWVEALQRDMQGLFHYLNVKAERDEEKAKKRSQIVTVFQTITDIHNNFRDSIETARRGKTRLKIVETIRTSKGKSYSPVCALVSLEDLAVLEALTRAEARKIVYEDAQITEIEEQKRSGG